MALTIPIWLRKLFPPNEFDPKAQLPSFENIIRDAELLLSYAATAGKALNDSDVKILTSAVEEHGTAKKGAVDNSSNLNYSDVVLAYSRVAKQLLPVTAFTLRKFFLGFRGNVLFYVWSGLIFFILVVFLSLLIFVSSAISDSIKTDIDLANSKAITLRAHLESPGQGANPASLPSTTTYSVQDLLIDLQLFAISVRSVDGRALRLSHLVVLSGIRDPFAIIRSHPDEMHQKFELDPRLAHPEEDFYRIVGTYQDVRAYAQGLRDWVAFWYGGIAATILPILYAILGVCAWSLRRIQIAIRDKAFADTGAKEHMLVAVIAGLLISLFSGLFASSGVSLSPLAWAFLAGYSSDAFFQVLEGLLRARTRGDSNSSQLPPQAGGT